MLRTVPPDARQVGTQSMHCEHCLCEYELPLYHMPEGPVITIARCPSCGERSNQTPDEVAS